MVLVMFDLDGTLLDGAGLPDAMRAACTELAEDVLGASADALVQANTAVWTRVWPEVEQDWMLGGRPGDEVAREVWAGALAECGLDAGLLDAAVAIWERHEAAALRLFDDVLPALDRLGRVGMVTNGAGQVQRRKLAAVGLADRFDPLLISGEAGVAKPDPAIFALALHAAGLGGEEAVFVGDNLWNDLPGAAENGMRTVLLDRRGIDLERGWPQPDEVITTLADLRV